METNQDTEVEEVKFKIDPTFKSQYNNWVSKGKPNNEQIKVGTTSDALISIGVDEQDIYWDTKKINDSLRKHKYLDDGVMLQVPEIIERPILIMQSKSFDSRLVMFGEVYDIDGLPIMAVLELLPTNKAKTVILDEIKLVSTHSRKDRDKPQSMVQTQNLIDNSTIYYVDPNKKRTNNWLALNGLQLPVGVTKYGSLDIISYPDIIVNPQDKKYLELAKDPEKNEAELREMVRDAAEKAGYTKKLYHGTEKFGFTKIDVSKSDDGISFFTTDSPELAQTYSNKSGETLINDDVTYTKTDAQNFESSVRAFVDKVNEIAGTEVIKYEDTPYYKLVNQAYEGTFSDAVLMTPFETTSYIYEVLHEVEKHTKTSSADELEIWKLSGNIDYAIYILNILGGTYGLYANTDGMLVVEGEGNQWNKIPFDKIPSKTTANTREIVAWAKDNGYQGVEFRDIYDSGPRSKKFTDKANIYAFFDPRKQVKSADLITYDDNGNVIPLSERFNSENQDIRFKVADGMRQLTKSEKAYLDIIDKNFRSQVDDYKKMSGGVFELGKTPKFLQRTSLSNIQIEVAPSVIEKAVDKHNIPVGTLKDLVYEVQVPVMAFPSISENVVPGSQNIVILTSMKNEEGVPVVCSVMLDAKKYKITVDKITSIQQKDNIKSFLERSIEKVGDKNYYINDKPFLYVDIKKTNKWLTAIGLQSPKLANALRLFDVSIPYFDEFVNPKGEKYLELAKEPEKNDAELREMVKATAEKAGYTKKIYHGTIDFGFTKIDVSKSDDGISLRKTCVGKSFL